MNVDKIKQELELFWEQERQIMSVDRLPGEFTLPEYMDQTGTTKDVARRRLERLVVDGKLTSRKIRHFKYYQPVQGR